MHNGNANPGAGGAPRLPSLDLLKGFEAAARLLSFTQAGAELHLTQSAVSRQIKELEAQLGVALFKKRHRALALTDAGRTLLPAAVQVLGAMRNATDRLRALSARRTLAVTTTHSFAALWLVPRLAGFTRTHPGVDVRIATDTRVQDLAREGLDVAIRHGPPAIAGPNAVRLFGERVFPVCSPGLLRDPKRPLRAPADLRHHVLLQYDDPEGRHPWLHWKTWQPRMAHLRVVVLEQAMLPQVGGLAQRVLLEQLRAAHREDALAEKPHGVRPGQRRRAVPDGEV